MNQLYEIASRYVVEDIAHERVADETQNEAAMFRAIPKPHVRHRPESRPVAFVKTENCLELGIRIWSSRLPNDNVDVQRCPPSPCRLIWSISSRRGLSCAMPLTVPG